MVDTKPSIPKCCLDDDNCVKLSSILDSFNAPINEEQCWALCYQIIQSLTSIKSCYFYLLTSPKYVFISKDGYVHKKSFTQTDSRRRLASSLNELIASIGATLFLALDYGLESQEERSLDPSLELLIDRLTCNDNESFNPSKHVNSDDYEDKESNDEGIERDSPEYEFQNLPEKCPLLDKSIKMCTCRLQSADQADNHYKAVTRALVTEGLELSSFLHKIATASQDLKSTSSNTVSQQSDNQLVDLKALCLQDWARLWMQVIQELRTGVKLKKVNLQEKPTFVFELTPYEMLMEDIKSRKYKLNKVMINGSIPSRINKDAHELILEFIRSRPVLVPVSNRKLPPPPPKQPTLFENLMQSIKSEHKLKPTTTNFGKQSPILLGRVCEHTPSHQVVKKIDLESSKTEMSTYSTPSKSSTPNQTKETLINNLSARRRAVNPNITLKLLLSIDDEDDIIQMQ